MGKQQEQGWLEQLVGGINGAIALVIEIVGFIVAFRGDHYLFATICGVLFALTLLLVCIHVVFARTSIPDPINKKEAYRFKKFRPLAIAGIGLILILSVAMFVYEPSRSFMVTGFTGLSTPTPLALLPAQPDETLLIITDFDNRSGGKIGVDPAQRIYNLINEKLPGSNLKLRVEQYHQPMKDSSEARRVLKAYGATILIWGWYDQVGAEPSVEVDKDRIKLSNPNSPEFNLATPESFVIRFTEEIPAQAGYTSFFALGMMQLQLGINDVAKDFFTQAIDSAQIARTGAVNPWEALMWRGNIYSWSGEQDLAILDYTEALTLHPHREGYYNRGVAYHDQGKYDLAIADYNQAIADYNQAIEIDPKFKEAYIGRGAAYTDQGNYDLAIADYNKAIEIGLKSKEVYFGRGTAYAAQGKYDLSIADYNKAIEIDPNYKEAYLGRGNNYSDQRQYDLAIADYTRVIEIDSKYPRAYSNRGVAYSIQGQYDLAIADYNQAIEIDSNYAAAYANRGRAYADQRKFDEAIDNYKTAIALDPKDPYTYCALGIAYTQIGDFPSAISNLEQGVQLDTKSKYPWCKAALDNARLGTPIP